MSPSKKTKPRHYLPINFVPHVNDVLVGRGRRVETHNQKFRAMIRTHLAAYCNAQTKATKSTIILRIFQQVKRGGGMGFVKREAASKRWYMVEDSAARVSIAQAFRDISEFHFSTQYKSSKQYKLLKRKEERGEAYPDLGLNDLLSSDFQDMPSMRPPSLVPEVSSSESGEFSRSYPRDVLAEASTVVTDIHAESMLRNSPEEALPLAESCDQDILAGLEHALGTNMDLTSNPFEPTPLRETNYATTKNLMLVYEEDLFHVFGSVPSLDMRQTLSV